MDNHNWKQIRLGDVVKINEKSIDRKFRYDEIEYFDTSSVYKNFFSEPLTITLNDAPSRARRIVRAGDIIISTVRPNQEHVGLIQKPKENTVVSTGFAVITPISIDSKFLYYYLSQPSIVAYLSAIAETSTSTFPAIRPEVLEDLQVTIPAHIEEQKRIGELLFLFDQKIDLNRKTDQTLEEIAQAIFKEWFVDFNYPGATGELIDSPLGPIPKGWIITPLSNVYSLEYGKGLPSTDRNPGSVPVYGSNGLIGYHDIPLVRGPGVVIGRKGSVGTVNWVNQDFFPIDTAFFVKLQLGGAITQFHYYQLKHVGFASYSTDTAVPGLNRIEAGRAKLITPEQNQLYLFNSIASPLFSFIHQNEIENQSLIRVRDTLINQIFCKDYLESER